MNYALPAQNRFETNEFSRKKNERKIYNQKRGDGLD